MIKRIYSVEISGECNFTKQCTWCPMGSSGRPRGLMSDETFDRVLYWLERVEAHSPLMLHGFGEPTLHPRFAELAGRIPNSILLSASSNGSGLTPEFVESVKGLRWGWISVSPWAKKVASRARMYLAQGGIPFCTPPGATHNWAGQAALDKDPEGGLGPCPFLSTDMAVIRWDGSVSTCCITDQESDVIGHVDQEPEDVSVAPCSVCAECHHDVPAEVRHV